MNELNMLGEWKEQNSYSVRTSAQGFMTQAQTSVSVASACGTGDPAKEDEQPSTGGSACGAADPVEKEEEPSAGGSACGAGDPDKTEEKPSACGSACGAGDPAKK